MRVTLNVFAFSALLIALLFSAPVWAQDSISGDGQPRGASTVLPETPQPQDVRPLTFDQRFKLQARVTFGPSAFIVPAAEAAYDIASPSHDYPREWKDGAGAFGRNYGAELARHTAGGVTRFAIAAVDREDPRYFASTSRRFAPRFVHALMFTISDRSNSGRRTLALSNFAGATAAGFVGMPYEPAGFNDVTHATQRASVEFATFGVHNVVTEFAPEIASALRKMHFPKWMVRAALTEDAIRP